MSFCLVRMESKKSCFPAPKLIYSSSVVLLAPVRAAGVFWEPYVIWGPFPHSHSTDMDWQGRALEGQKDEDK